MLLGVFLFSKANFQHLLNVDVFLHCLNKGALDIDISWNRSSSFPYQPRMESRHLDMQANPVAKCLTPSCGFGLIPNISYHFLFQLPVPQWSLPAFCTGPVHKATNICNYSWYCWDLTVCSRTDCPCLLVFWSVWPIVLISCWSHRTMCFCSGTMSLIMLYRLLNGWQFGVPLQEICMSRCTVCWLSRGSRVSLIRLLECHAVDIYQFNSIKFIVSNHNRSFLWTLYTQSRSKPHTGSDDNKWNWLASV